MSSLLSTIKTIVFIIFFGCLLLITLIILIVFYSMVYNEIRLVFFTQQTKQYSHPQDSKLIQGISFVGNFALASSQCGFVIAEVRTTTLKPNAIYAFYKPLTIAPNSNYPYHEVTIFMLSDEEDVKILKQSYAELYERIAQKEGAYVLLTEEAGYTPNYDFRCN